MLALGCWLWCAAAAVFAAAHIAIDGGGAGAAAGAAAGGGRGGGSGELLVLMQGEVGRNDPAVGFGHWCEGLLHEVAHACNCVFQLEDKQIRPIMPHPSRGHCEPCFYDCPSP